jgi:hypothetical protein
MKDKNLAMRTVTYLENYISDLDFQLSHGADFVNYCTDETPEFTEDHEAEAYISRIKSLVSELKTTWRLDS